MDIEALVKKHISRNGWSFAHDGECAKSLRAALTELAAEYENVASVTKTNSERLLRKANERIQQLEAEKVPEGWMRDISQVESLISHLESIAYYQTINGDIECINQAAAMSVDVLRLVLLPMLAAAPAQEKV